MLLRYGVRLTLMLLLAQFGITACTNGGTAVMSSSSAAADANSSSTSVTQSSSSSVSSMTSSSASSKSSSSSSSVSSMASSSASSKSSSTSSSASSMTSSSVSSTTGALSISVSGSYFVDAKGKQVQLRGVSIMGMEYTAIGGWSPSDPYPQIVASTWPALLAWKVNVIRIPLNEDSYLGLTCANQAGTTENADPGSNYKTRLKQVVDTATANGFYVILDLHWTAPDDPLRVINGVDTQCAQGQNPMADVAHSIPFWNAVATDYKGYSNVMFELFNEPFLDMFSSYSGPPDVGIDAVKAGWEAILDGALVDSYVPQWTASTGHTWQSAGMQAMLNTIRATGATNVILEGGRNYASNLDEWLQYHAIDPINQLAAVWHAYPDDGTTWGTSAYTLPNYGQSAYDWANAVIAAGIPVIVTEYGDQNSPGTVGAPFASTLLPKLDAMNAPTGISYLGWAFTVTQDPSNILIKDNNGTPTDGYGQYVLAHYLCRDAGTANCP